MSMSFKASPDGTFGEILVNGQVVAKLPVTGNAVIPNLVGTVSQSGGVPTGAVVERGFTASGSYVRFADGTQICWAPVETSASNDVSWIYPVVFSSSPIVCGQCQTGGLEIVAATSPGPTSMGGISVYTVSSSRVSRTTRFIATGRWF